MNNTIGILGTGAWSTALAVQLARKYPQATIRLWSAHAERVVELQSQRVNAKLLPGIAIPSTVTITSDIDLAASSTTWVLGVPTAYLRAVLEQFRGKFPNAGRIVSLTKGIEHATFERPSEMATEILGNCPMVILSGPSHAEEVARGLPTSVVAASDDAEFASWVQTTFGTERFRVYTNSDPIGVELAGALKNVISIAAGVCDGLAYGDNAKAALLTRGLVEMIRFGVAHGADPATFHGLAGIGDLITTCFSSHGRNRRVGERLARGESLQAILTSPQVAEGVYTAKSVHDRATQMGLDLPIMSAVHAILYEGRSPTSLVQNLMTRRMRAEK
jgi:glycerol-3-phosphate dehydrogenase (NAD(P)+)